VILSPIPTKREGDGSLFESKILVKSPIPRFKAQRKVDYKNYETITMSRIMRRNYYRKLSASISRRKCGSYRDTGVSKNMNYNQILK
jgi:hypothetical protein